MAQGMLPSARVPVTERDATCAEVCSATHPNPPPRPPAPLRIDIHMISALVFPCASRALTHVSLNRDT